MTEQPLFTPTPDGTAYDIQPAGVLMLLADTVYGDSGESSQAGRARAKAMIAKIRLPAWLTAKAQVRSAEVRSWFAPDRA